MLCMACTYRWFRSDNKTNDESIFGPPSAGDFSHMLWYILLMMLNVLHNKLSMKHCNLLNSLRSCFSHILQIFIPSLT